MHYSLWIQYESLSLSLFQLWFFSPTFGKIVRLSFLSLQQKTCVAYRNCYFINEVEYLLQTFQKPRGDKEVKYLLASTLWHSFSNARVEGCTDKNELSPSHHILTTVIYLTSVPSSVYGWMAGKWWTMVSNHKPVPRSLTDLHSVLHDEMA